MSLHRTIVQCIASRELHWAHKIPNIAFVAVSLWQQ